jgi:hypothetical protein
MTICKNCNQQFEGNYCNNCGQSANTHSINIHFLWHDIQEGLFHFERGILFTIKELFIRPGYTIREFLDGKRVKHFKPISFLIILATINGLLYHYLKINIVSATNRASHFASFMNEWRANHYSIIQLLALPAFTVASWVVFRKNNRNFLEHFVLNAYLIGLLVIAGIVLVPLFYIYRDTSRLSIVLTISHLVNFPIAYWVYYQFFDQRDKIKLVFKILMTLLLYYFLFIVTMILLFISKKYLFS